MLNEDKSPMNLVNIKKQLLANKGKDGKTAGQESPRIDIRRPPRLPNNSQQNATTDEKPGKPPLKQQDAEQNKEAEAQEELQTPRALNDLENGDVSVHGAAGEKSSKSNKFKTEAKENNGGKTSAADAPAQAATEVKSVRDANSARAKSFR